MRLVQLMKRLSFELESFQIRLLKARSPTEPLQIQSVELSYEKKDRGHQASKRTDSLLNDKKRRKSIVNNLFFLPSHRQKLRLSWTSRFCKYLFTSTSRMPQRSFSLDKYIFFPIGCSVQLS